ncbi:glycosyltransferase [Clostridium perfringens]
MKEALVTVIVTVYNSEDSIEKCILSILNQNYLNLEIICVNDGSSDKSVEIIKKIIKKDKRVKLINKGNGGVSTARNLGLKNAKGKYVQFVDSDDTIKFNMTEKLVSIIEKEKSDLVICGYDILGQNKQCKYYDKKYYDRSEFWKDFFNLYSIGYLNPPWNKLFKNRLIENFFDEDISLGEDIIFNLSYIKKANRISVIEDCLYNYSLDNEESLTKKFHENAFYSFQKIIYSIKENLPENIFLEKKNKLFNLFFIDYFRCLNSLINKSKKNKLEIKKTINDWSNDPIIEEILNENNKKSILNKIIESKNKDYIFYAFKFLKMKSYISNNIKKFLN